MKAEWLERYAPPPGIARSKSVGGGRGGRAGERKPNLRALIRMKPQETLDLHGLTAREAEAELERFIVRCKKRNVRKVLVIHGKGNNSADNRPVLRNMVTQYCRENGGEKGSVSAWGHPDPAGGGAGATWMIL